MDDRTSQGPRRRYTSHLAPESGARPARRPSGFAAPEASKRPTRKEPPKPEKKPSRERKPPREKQPNNKRARGKGPGWKKIALIALGVAIVLSVALALLLGGGRETYHQLPRVERGSDSAYVPEDTAAPEGAAGEANP